MARNRIRWVALLLTVLVAAEVSALDPEHRRAAEDSSRKAIAYLRASQSPDGSWSAKAGPAITGLVAAGMLRAGVDPDDPVLAKALRYILAAQKPDGGIYDSVLDNYNTAVCLMALGLVRDKDPAFASACRKAQDFLVGLQWDDSKTDPDGKVITPEHPWYGGVGYGKHGRPDNSNLALWVAALHDSGYDCSGEAYQRMTVFVSRLQGTASNKEWADRITPDGGFIYATSESRDKLGVPQSMAGSVVSHDGKSLLRTYGSMTYAGFMSYLYAQLPPEDPRVADARRWILHHYTLEQNPGMVDNPATPADERFQGYFYYLHLFSRALRAYADLPSLPAEQRGQTLLATPDGESHDWANDLIDKLVSLQNSDGSWVNSHDRWMEGDPNLVTAYALHTLQHARQ